MTKNVKQSPILAAQAAFVLMLDRVILVLCRIILVLSHDVLFYSCCVVLPRIEHVLRCVRSCFYPRCLMLCRDVSCWLVLLVV